ncbi:hypothetical protein B296_00053588, partial [Ensete ventricosum]
LQHCISRKKAIRDEVEHGLAFNTIFRLPKQVSRNPPLTHHLIRCIPHRPMSLQIPLLCSPSPGWHRGSIPPVRSRKQSRREETAIGKAIGI